MCIRDRFRVVEHVIFSLDEDGRLVEPVEQIADMLLVPLFRKPVVR